MHDAGSRVYHQLDKADGTGEAIDAIDSDDAGITFSLSPILSIKKIDPPLRFVLPDCTSNLNSVSIRRGWAKSRSLRAQRSWNLWEQADVAVNKVARL